MVATVAPGAGLCCTPPPDEPEPFEVGGTGAQPAPVEIGGPSRISTTQMKLMTGPLAWLGAPPDPGPVLPEPVPPEPAPPDPLLPPLPELAPLPPPPPPPDLDDEDDDEVELPESP